MVKMLFLAPLIVLLGPCLAQQIGTTQQEVHPILVTYKCTTAGGCVAQNTKLVMDQNWRYLHAPNPTSAAQNCINPDGSWNTQYCPDPTTCAKTCELDGINYTTQGGVFTSGSSLTLTYFQTGSQQQTGRIGNRVYLMADDQHYEILSLKNQEITFDVDVSGLPCAANGALYLVSMQADGGKSAYPNNAAGATYGTGYCDSQCRRDLKFISGQANSIDWSNSQGFYGSCCTEMDIWEANAASTQMTAHACDVAGPYRCASNTADCSSTGVCDQAGCDFNPYRMGNKTFYGQSGTVNTLPGKIRVITQFKTADGTSKTALSQITRSYIRGGKVIYNANSDISGVSGNGLTDAYCTQENTAFGGNGMFEARGGMTGLSSALDGGMVLAFSTFWDYAYQMLWLDSVYPSGASASTLGAARGSCPTTPPSEGAWASQYPTAQVQFSNIKWGDIGTTFGPPYP